MAWIEADVLIPGVGDVIRNGVVIIEKDRIAFAGPAESAPRVDSDVKTYRVPAVMPGMWDVHGHFMGMPKANFDDLPRIPMPELAMRTAEDAKRALMAGFTSVREVGGLGVHLARVVDEGSIVGPHIYGAGQALSQTGGHGDLHSFPLEVVSRWGNLFSYLCDGVPECLKGVRTQLRSGAKVIKVLASGGVMSELDHPSHQQFSDEELRAIVEEAGRADRVVAAHCHGKPGIVASLRAGCKTIEHGTYLDEETAEMMIARDAVLVPTRFILERLLKFAKEAEVPDYAYRKLSALSDRHWKALQLAIRQGVAIAVGTDIFTSGAGTPIAWGMNGQEVLHLVEAGMDPRRAIEAATANGPLTLGPQAPKAGRLEAGYDADVIALAKDPISTIGVLAAPDKITHVWKSGMLVKEVEI